VNQRTQRAQRVNELERIQLNRFVGFAAFGNRSCYTKSSLCIWILGEGHSASLRSVGSTSWRHRLCALACSLVTMGRVRASRPVSTRPRRPCPFFCAAKSNFKVPMVLILFSVSPAFSRASAEVGGAFVSQSRRGAPNVWDTGGAASLPFKRFGFSSAQRAPPQIGRDGAA